MADGVTDPVGVAALLEELGRVVAGRLSPDRRQEGLRHLSAHQHRVGAEHQRVEVVDAVQRVPASEDHHERAVRRGEQWEQQPHVRVELTAGGAREHGRRADDGGQGQGGMLKVVVDEEVLPLEQRGERCRVVVGAVPLAQVGGHGHPWVELVQRLHRAAEAIGVAGEAERSLMAADRHRGLLPDQPLHGRAELSQLPRLAQVAGEGHGNVEIGPDEDVAPGGVGEVFETGHLARHGGSLRVAHCMPPRHRIRGTFVSGEITPLRVGRGGAWSPRGASCGVGPGKSLA